MKISIIIPTYNRGGLLLRAVKSAMDQSYTNLEVVVIDDGSVDNSLDALESSINDSRLVIHKLGENMGVHMARNKGIEICTGEYIIFLDSDDTINANAVETFVSIIRDIGAKWISAPYEVTSGGLSGINVSQSGWISKEDIFCERNVRRDKAGLGCIEKKCIGDIRFVAPNLDFIFYRRLTKKTNLYYYVSPLGVYHRDPNPNSLHIKRKRLNPELSIIRAREIDIYLNEFEDDLISFCPNMLAAHSYGAAVGLLLSGNIEQARFRARQCVRHGKFKMNFLCILALSYLPLGRSIIKYLFSYSTRELFSKS